MKLDKKYLLVTEGKEIYLNNIKIITDKYGNQDYTLYINDDISKAIKILKGDKLFNLEYNSCIVKKKDVISDCSVYVSKEDEYIKVLDIYSLIISSYSEEEKEIAFNCEYMLYYDEGYITGICSTAIEKFKLNSITGYYNGPDYIDENNEDYEYDDWEDDYIEDDYYDYKEKDSTILNNFKNSINKIINKII